MSDVADLERELGELTGRITALRGALGRVFVGHAERVDELLAALVAGGHVLIEGAPGLGKTTLVRGLAGALALEWRRIQFTADLMPADVLGSRVLEEGEGSRRFVFHEGPIFANVVLADEINRAAPRTQSALLEAMAERQVTAFGETRALDEPFFVVATQNPIEMEGTYPLPEAQLDRFLLQIRLANPTQAELEEVLAKSAAPGFGRGPTVDEPVLERAQLLRLQELATTVPASSDVRARIARIVRATHPEDGAPEAIRRAVRFGASPRGAQALLWTARARALLAGRVAVTDADVDAVAAPALRHRLILGYEAEATGIDPDGLVAAALEAAS